MTYSNFSDEELLRAFQRAAYTELNEEVAARLRARNDRIRELEERYVGKKCSECGSHFNG